MRSHLPLTVEIDRDVLGNRCRLLVADALLFRRFVGRQANGVLHCLVVVREPAKHAARQLLGLSFRELLELATDRLGALLGVGVLVAVTRLPAFALEFLKQISPIR